MYVGSEHGDKGLAQRESLILRGSCVVTEQRLQ